MTQAAKKETKQEAAKLRVKNTQEAIKDAGGVSGARLKSFIERVERLEEEKNGISEDVRDVYAEAKGTGFSTRALKHVIRIREYDREHGSDARRSEEAIIETYLNALGML